MSGRLAGTILAAALAAGSSGALAGSPEGLPSYGVGDTLTWSSNGIQWQEEAVAVEGDLVTWQLSNGDRIEASANFALPPRHWMLPTEGGTELIEQDGELFPLEAGKRMRIRFRELPDGAEETRFCTVHPPEAVTVPAGTFDAYKVTCQEFNRTRTWYYAPEAESVVFYLNSHRIDGGSAQELVSVSRGGAG